MSINLASMEETWTDHVQNLIKVTAKKGSAIAPKHQLIVEKASPVFFKKGFHPTSIRDIAEAAGMSTGQLYHYISSKDDVLFLIHKHMQTNWYLFIQNSDIESINDPYLKFRTALEATIHFMFQNMDLIQFIYTESKYLSKKHLSVVLAMDDRYVVRFWQDLIQDVLGDKTSNNYINFAGNLMAYLLVFFSLRGWNMKSMSQNQIKKYLVNFIFQGLGLTKDTGIGI